MVISPPEADLLRARDDFERARFAATARACRALRHDLVTPISAAMLHLDLASRAAERSPAETSERVRKALTVARREIASAGEFLCVLGELGHSGDHETSLEPVDLGEAAAMAVDGVASALVSRGVTVPKPPHGEVAVFADRDELAAALAAVFEGGLEDAVAGSGSVEISGTPSEARLVLRLPHGPAASGEWLFQMNRRAHGSTRGTHLFRARWRIESLGGSLDAVLEPGFLTLTAILPRESR